MVSDRAKHIVQKTFENSFDKDRFQFFIHELLNTFDDSKTFINTGNIIPKAFQDHVSTIERLGKYHDSQDNEIDILIVTLKKSSSLDKARTLQRNLIARYLNGSRGGILKDAALVAFITKDSPDWRFSLVKMDYQIATSDKGQVKVKQEITPSKRFSFLVGKNESSHTAQSQLSPFLDNEKNPTLQDLENVFNIEKVTKEFFEEYRNLFIQVKESLDDLVEKKENIKLDFERKHVDTVDFAKKLLGQIVFLYFLQKKGWFGVKRGEEWGTGSKSFLRDLFDKKIITYNNFFNDALESLFYDALARNRSNVDYFNPQFNCKIPFLNGGLFDPLGDYDWSGTDIKLPNALFSNSEKTKKGDSGTGILDIFDRYNFTVKEDEPLEKEVAIDPEMLGKVFENLLEVKDRKSKGTYYTPREIVHYMCQQSLINYLITACGKNVPKADIETLVIHGDKIIEHEEHIANTKETKTYPHKLSKELRGNAELVDDKLASITVCDPAIGSGAFPVGMMAEIVKARDVLSHYLPKDSHRNKYSFKRQAIQSSIYGVDIDAGAVEIAKLRLWLSLIVDEEDIRLIKPLPNLDYKIMQGNSLIELYNPEDLHESLDTEKNTIIRKLRELKNQFLITTERDEKRELREQISGLMVKLVNYDKYVKLRDLEKKKQILQNQGSLFSSSHQSDLFKVDSRELAKLQAELSKISETMDISPTDHFEWHLNFDEIFAKVGFDIVIANPPYVGEKGHKEIFRQIKSKNLGRFYQGKMDLFYFFFHLALNLSKDNGIISIISTNYYITATGAKILRKDIFERADIIELINFGDYKIFESALGQHNIITFLQKTKIHKESYRTKQTIVAKGSSSTTAELNKILLGTSLSASYSAVDRKRLFKHNNFNILFSAKGFGTDKLLDKIEISSSQLGELCAVNQGVVPGVMIFTAALAKKFPSINAQVGEPIFVFPKGKLKEILGRQNRKLAVPYFKNSEVHRYFTESESDKELLYSDGSNELPSELISYLQKFKPILKSRREFQDDARPWYTLHWARSKSIFEGPKIVVPYRSSQNTFAYNERPFYGATDIYYITEKIEKKINLKSLLGILNSRLIYLWLYNRGKRKGNILELLTGSLSDIPIQLAKERNLVKIATLVERIIIALKANKLFDTYVYEKQINQEVYELYGLTKEEIEIVESTAK